MLKLLTGLDTGAGVDTAADVGTRNLPESRLGLAVVTYAGGKT